VLSDFEHNQGRLTVLVVSFIYVSTIMILHPFIPPALGGNRRGTTWAVMDEMAGWPKLMAKSPKTWSGLRSG